MNKVELGILPSSEALQLRGLDFDCSKTSESCILRSVGLAVPRGEIATVMKTDKDKGAAVIGLLLNFCGPGGKSIEVNSASLEGLGPRM